MFELLPIATEIDPVLATGTTLSVVPDGSAPAGISICAEVPLAVLEIVTTTGFDALTVVQFPPEA